MALEADTLLDADRLMALDQDLKQYPYVWTGNSYLPERKKQKCKVLKQKKSKKHDLVIVEFEDGTKVLSSKAFLKKRATR